MPTYTPTGPATSLTPAAARMLAKLQDGVAFLTYSARAAASIRAAVELQGLGLVVLTGHHAAGRVALEAADAPLGVRGAPGRGSIAMMLLHASMALLLLLQVPVPGLTPTEVADAPGPAVSPELEAAPAICATEQPCGSRCISWYEKCESGAPPPPPVLLTPEQEEANERKETRAREDDSSKAVERDLASRRLKLRFALLIPSIVSSGVALAGLALRVPADSGSSIAGPVCTTGKRCGNACIAVADDCHVSTPSAGSTVTPAGWAVFGIGLAHGIGLLIASFVAPPRLQPRALACGPAGCSLLLRF